MITWFSNTASFSDIDECLAVPNPCENGATCVDNDGFYTCSCLAGYEGPNCQDSKIFIVSASIKLISYIHLPRQDSFKQTVAKLDTVLLKIHSIIASKNFDEMHNMCCLHNCSFVVKYKT